MLGVIFILLAECSGSRTWRDAQEMTAQRPLKGLQNPGTLKYLSTTPKQWILPRDSSHHVRITL